MRESNPTVTGRKASPRFCIASSIDDYRSALGLVYAAYLRDGLISKNEAELRVTSYHLMESTQVMIARHAGEVAATMTLVGDSHLGLPMESAFADEVLSRRELGINLVEISCLADRRASMERSFPLLMKLMSFATQFGISIGLEEALITVRPRHAGFYSKYLGFKLISEPRDYDAISGTQAVALSLDLVKLQQEDTEASRRLLGKTFSSSLFKQSPLSPQLLAELNAIMADTYHDDLPSCNGEEEETEAGHESLPPPALAV